MPHAGGRCLRLPVTHADGTPVRCELEECNPASVNSTYFYDVGGQWVGPTQTRFLSMAEEYGVKKYEATQCKLSTTALWRALLHGQQPRSWTNFGHLGWLGWTCHSDVNSMSSELLS
jgi:monoamine oxidase